MTVVIEFWRWIVRGRVELDDAVLGGEWGVLEGGKQGPWRAAGYVLSSQRAGKWAPATFALTPADPEKA